MELETFEFLQTLLFGESSSLTIDLDGSLDRGILSDFDFASNKELKIFYMSQPILPRKNQ